MPRPATGDVPRLSAVTTWQAEEAVVEQRRQPYRVLDQREA